LGTGTPGTALGRVWAKTGAGGVAAESASRLKLRAKVGSVKGDRIISTKFQD
jgi:hypothetical protein